MKCPAKLLGVFTSLLGNAESGAAGLVRKLALSSWTQLPSSQAPCQGLAAQWGPLGPGEPQDRFLHGDCDTAVGKAGGWVVLFS